MPAVGVGFARAIIIIELLNIFFHYFLPDMEKTWSPLKPSYRFSIFGVEINPFDAKDIKTQHSLYSHYDIN